MMTIKTKQARGRNSPKPEAVITVRLLRGTWKISNTSTVNFSILKLTLTY